MSFIRKTKSYNAPEPYMPIDEEDDDDDDELEIMKKGGRKKKSKVSSRSLSNIKSTNKQGNINIKINIGKERRERKEKLERTQKSEANRSKEKKIDRNEPLKPSSFVKLLSRSDAEPLNKIYSGNTFRVSKTTPIFGGMTHELYNHQLIPYQLLFNLVLSLGLINQQLQ
jgi:hypothetical protein